MPQQGNKRSLTIARHRTSVSIEDAFWAALAEIAEADGKSVAGLISEIDRKRGETGESEQSLSAAIRLYVLARTKDARVAR
jgi:predicted DNA-binding ribbon-helix-helix protein